ncbi:MAG: SDR family oxidoreductase [Acidimicrobiales bacterium]
MADQSLPADPLPPVGDGRQGPVLVTGATGYVGGRLVPELLAAGHAVRCLARTPDKLDGFAWRGDVEVVKGDVTDKDSVRTAMAGCRAAYFLVHSMGGSPDFATRDRQAAATFCDAAAATEGMARLVYLGGLGDEDDEGLSPHLRSRHEVGRVLADGPVPVTELRAAVVIGSGSASFEMLRHLVETLPVMVTPKWVHTRCQPIAIRDVLAYLVATLDEPGVGDGSRVLEIGGPDVLTYAEMMRTYASVAGLPKRLMVKVPVLSPNLSSHWINIVTPLPRALARPLIESIVNEVVVTDDAARVVLRHEPITFRRAVEEAIRRVEHLDVSTTWSSASLPGASPADPLPTDPDWSGGIVMRDERSVTAAATPAAVFAAVSGVGGGRGWYVADFLWGVRGFLDRMVGGIGRRRGRRHPDLLRVGDALDFWRVEAHLPPDQPRPAGDGGELDDGEGLLRLRAEMRLPGEAWIEWRVTPGDDERTVLRQRALFHPTGLFGRLYWYAMVPFHAVIFAGLARELAAEAEHRAADPEAAEGPAPVAPDQPAPAT